MTLSPQHPGSRPLGTSAPPLPDGGPPPVVDRSLKKPRPSVLGLIANLLRGVLMGLAELVPGVSGGTVALVTGVYERLIASASHTVNAARLVASGPNRLEGAQAELRKIDWWLLVPLLTGMAAVVLTLAGVLESFVTNEPVVSRALFSGLVLASISVPLLMIPAEEWRGAARKLGALLIIVVAAAAAFVASGLPGNTAGDPSLVVVFLAAAVAICALVLPGVSGSYFLLTVGLYSATLTAVDERNLTYIAVFGAGAVVGLSAFVKLLQYLLTSHRRVTLLVMSGLMLGSLRALWPWQNEDRDILPVGDDWPLALGLAAAGAVVVAVLVFVESRFGAVPHAPVEPAPEHTPRG